MSSKIYNHKIKAFTFDFYIKSKTEIEMAIQAVQLLESNKASKKQRCWFFRSRWWSLVKSDLKVNENGCEFIRITAHKATD